MPTILIQNPVLGGLADSRYLGIANSLYKIVGFDLISEPGIMKVHQKLKKESGTTIDGLIKNAVVCSNGETYLFSSATGKVWRRTSAGVWSLAYTTIPTSGGAGCLGAKEYNGYIYWATQNYLHRIAIANALVATWATLDANWQTFTNGDADYHPMRIAQNTLYIGDKNSISQVLDTTFTAAALDDIVLPFRASALGKLKSNVLVGTFISSKIMGANIFDWNGWSLKFSNEDDSPELGGINCFIPADNYVLAQCGYKGNLYSYDGSYLMQTKRIPGNWSNGNEAIVYPEAAANDGGIIKFGLSQIAGAPAECGVYGYGSYDAKYAKILTLDYLISTGAYAAVDIGSVFFVGEDLLVAWADRTITLTPTYGVDIIDTANKFASAYFDTRVIATDRDIAKDFYIEVHYRLLPTNCDIVIQASVNGGAYATITSVNDTINLKKTASTRVTGANCVQFRVKTTTSANTAPEIESALIQY
jgi:hypothetical protein